MPDSVVHIDDNNENSSTSEQRALLSGSEHELQDLRPQIELPLSEILKKGDEEGFLNKYTRSSNLLTNKIQLRLLNIAIKDKRSDNVIDAILSNVTDFNYPLKFLNPFESVCLANNVEVFKKLLRHGNLNLPTMKILKSLIGVLDESFFNEWFDILYNLKKFDLNEVDDRNRTLLWYALWEENNTAIEKLLQKRAYIGAPIHFDNYFSFRKPLNPQDIRECFDSCMTTQFVLTKQIKFNYRNLVPPKKNQVNEMDAIMLIINSKEHLHLLKHPLITSFMALKWQSMAKCLYINLFLFCFYSVSFLAYTIFMCKHFAPDSGFVILTWWLTILGIGYLIIRELMQLLVPKEYLKKPINYLELTLIGFSICAITMDFESSFWKEIVVSTILLMVTLFCNLVENFPILFVSTHMLMLQEVLKSFLKSFSLYSIFVFTFAISFYILFGVEQNKTDQSNESSTPEHRFGNISTSFIKTMAMFIGELDLEGLELKTDIFRNIVFLLFVICITIVLMNLLNGIAVTDIQEMRDEAELNGLISRAKFLKNHDYKLFPHHNNENENENENEEEESNFCCCKYSCIVEPEHKYFPNKVSFPNGCALCCKKYNEVDRKKCSNTNQWTWSKCFHLNNLRKILDFCIENPTVMESSIVKASINVIINKEKSSSYKKNELKDMTILENNTNTIQEIYNRVENIEPNAKNIQTNFESVEHKIQNIENQVENVKQKVQNIELNEQSIVSKLHNIEQKFENMKMNVKVIEQNIQNIGQNVEKILNNFKKQ